MGIMLEQREDSTLVRLEGVIDIACAAELKAAFRDGLVAGNAIQVSLDQISSLDVTAVQLLWAALRAARTSGVDFSLVGQVSEPVSDAVRDAGFEGFPV